MKYQVCDFSPLDGPYVRFSVLFTDDRGKPMMIYPGWTINVYREVQPPATRTAKGFYKRFTEISPMFERELLALVQQEFPEVDEILGPKPPKKRRIKMGPEIPGREDLEPSKEPSSN